MLSTSSPIFPALSAIAIVLSAITFYFTQQEAAPQAEKKTAVYDSAPLEQSIEVLTNEILRLGTRLESLEELASKDSSPLAKTANKEDTESDQELVEARINQAVEAVIEERGVELAQEAQRRAKRQQGRTGMSRWVDNSRDKLPNLYDQIADTMNLDPRTELEVEEILETGFETLTMITNELLEGDLNDEEVTALQIEAKDEFGNIIEQLDEILEPQEMIQLGQIYSEEVDPKVGGAITNNGNQGVEEAAEEN
ncbi:MAG: hypothetical protein AAEJ04_06645 [Planctomycetota bacterium]